MFLSIDKGVTFKRVGVNDLSTTTGISVTRAPDYADSKIVYGVVKEEGGGVWRIEINEDDADSTEWERIDLESGSRNPNADNVSPFLAMVYGGVFYTIDKHEVVSGDAYGGLWRSTNPTASMSGTAPPSFYRENNGLPAGVVWTYSTGTGSVPRTWFFKSSDSSIPYYNRLMGMTDVLNSGVTLLSPEDGAKGLGYSEMTTSLTRTVPIAWETKTGATHYYYYVSTADGKRKIDSDTITGKETTITGLVAGQEYRWKVKVKEPFESPYSPFWYFSVSSPATYDIISPTQGAIGVEIQPVFVWMAYPSAIGYEIMVSEDPSFAIIDFSHSTGADQTSYKSGEALAYNTTYYWRARGITGAAAPRQPAPGGPWANGVFTTMAKPVEPTPPVIIEKEPAPPPEIKVVEVPVPGPAQAIPSPLLWAIIAIGAILVIALIILIVRTRRVT
jgi:hypothetical protein